MFSAESNGTDNYVQLKILQPVVNIQWHSVYPFPTWSSTCSFLLTK